MAILAVEPDVETPDAGILPASQPGGRASPHKWGRYLMAPITPPRLPASLSRCEGDAA